MLAPLFLVHLWVSLFLEFSSNTGSIAFVCLSHTHIPAHTTTHPHHTHPHRLEYFKGAVVKEFSREHSQSLTLTQLTTAANADPAHQFTDAQVSAALDLMQDANQVMVSEGVVFLI